MTDYLSFSVPKRESRLLGQVLVRYFFKYECVKDIFAILKFNQIQLRIISLYYDSINRNESTFQSSTIILSEMYLFKRGMHFM